MLELGPSINEKIYTHAEADYPDECGGILIGKIEGEKRFIVDVIPLKNAREPGERGNRILITPDDVLAAEREAARQQLDVLGYYHSHPDDAAIPSQYDLEHALPFWSYLIVSVRQGKSVDLRSWRMLDDRSQFLEELIDEVTTTGDLAAHNAQASF